ncbi:hypothetical protein [Pseudomonas auratipiscis]|uniref:Uncharacterized protein n=1 Tax=Pseudomonas auratipiscis TaxID=3115853 RepID=A0AB35X020_9PSED|nr:MULTISPECIES: hypothetical protein [unclassified Pseudomonas]MEE1869034.1 hypothetical protein [Pseudomonas sp. 120P]MEE1959681.1 hypothetical protein [Pseudomonas sp. 119P]
MQAKHHMPGPWAVNQSSPDADQDKVSIEVGDGVYFICQVDGGMHQMANARLIAVAPEMFDDLALAAQTLRRYEALHRAKNTDDSFKKAEVNAELASRFERTIAKATS